MADDVTRVTSGIDPGQAMGLAVINGNEVLDARTMKIKGKDHHRFHETCSRVATYFSDLKEGWRPELVCIEEPVLVYFKKPGTFGKASYPNVRSYGVISMYVSAIGIALDGLSIPYKIVNNKTCKAWIAHGRATKDEVATKVSLMSNLGLDIKGLDNNATDALSYAYYAQNELGCDWRIPDEG